MVNFRGKKSMQLSSFNQWLIIIIGFDMQYLAFWACSMPSTWEYLFYLNSSLRVSKKSLTLIWGWWSNIIKAFLSCWWHLPCLAHILSTEPDLTTKLDSSFAGSFQKGFWERLLCPKMKNFTCSNIQSPFIIEMTMMVEAWLENDEMEYRSMYKTKTIDAVLGNELGAVTMS